MQWWQPSESLYIKLGDGGRLAADCIERGVIRVGFREIPHDLCAFGEWEQVFQKCLIVRKGNQREANQDVRELRQFYGSQEDAVWLTFHSQYLYWCFARGPVYEVPSAHGDYRRTRATLDGWHCTDLRGASLHETQLSGRLTKTKGYRRTICNLDELGHRYLAARVQGQRLPEVTQAEDRALEYSKSLAELVRLLTPRDFELLVDLCFARTGWQRTSVIGESMQDSDLMLQDPLLKRTAMVQVKSTADLPVLKDYVQKFRVSPSDYLFFVWHSGTLQAGFAISLFPELGDRLRLLDCDALAALAQEVGLSRWIIDRMR